MALGSAETSPSSSFASDELSPFSVSLSHGSPLSAGPTRQSLTLSPMSFVLQILSYFCKNHILSLASPLYVIQIL